MKISFIGQKGIPANSGGVERYVEDLAERVLKLGNEVVVYTRPYYTSTDLKEYKGIKLVSLPSIHTKHLDAITHTFLATIHACFKGTDVIHYQSIGAALVSWIPKAFKPKIRIISTLQSKDYEHQKWGSFAKFILRLGETMMCRFSDEIIVVTEPMKQYVQKNYNMPVHYIPNGSNLYEAGGVETIKQWGLEPKQYIVAISRLVRHKGLGYLVQAYKHLGLTDKRLVIVGDGSFTDDYVRELKTLVGDDERIIFTGQQTGQTLAELYDNAYLFVQPSESEGLSLALLEAMARRLPVLVSNINENIEAIGDAGFIFENKNVDDLREKLRFILTESELAQEKGEAGRKRIEEKFNWDKIAQEVVTVYNSAAIKELSFSDESSNIA